MNNETLLAKARKLYPMGTKFISPVDGEKREIKHENYFKGTSDNIYCALNPEQAYYNQELSGCIYLLGKWATIIESVVKKSKIIQQEITIVENAEGCLFKINDPIITNKGYSNTIKSFEINKDIIYAVFTNELKGKFNVNINLLELDIQPEDTFILPEAWYIILTKENREIVEKWYGFKNNYHLPLNSILGMNKWYINGNFEKIEKGWNLTLQTNIIDRRYSFLHENEITTEQFIKYVLTQ